MLQRMPLGMPLGMLLEMPLRMHPGIALSMPLTDAFRNEESKERLQECL